MVLIITDECSDKKLRETLQRSYRSLRPPRKQGTARKSLYHLHDDMYFGDSRYSVGIQLADLCSYFIARHLEGDDEIAGFYERIQPYIVHKSVYPEQTNPHGSALLNMLGGQLNLEEPQTEPVSEFRTNDDALIQSHDSDVKEEVGRGDRSEGEAAREA